VALRMAVSDYRNDAITKDVLRAELKQLLESIGPDPDAAPPAETNRDRSS
jgi:hypothetical protein